MANSIQVFRFIQKIHQDIGIFPSPPNQKQCALNSKNTFFLFALAQYGLTVVAYSVFDAKMMVDYAFGFIALVSIVNSILIYLLFIWQQEYTVKFIENCDRFIEKSMCQN